jgi:hypothetical protein
MASDKPVSNYEEAIEDGDAPKEAKTVHRIRANSTIMQVNKILGECAAGLLVSEKGYYGVVLEDIGNGDFRGRVKAMLT